MRDVTLVNDVIYFHFPHKCKILLDFAIEMFAAVAFISHLGVRCYEKSCCLNRYDNILFRDNLCISAFLYGAVCKKRIPVMRGFLTAGFKVGAAAKDI